MGNRWETLLWGQNPIQQIMLFAGGYSFIIVVVLLFTLVVSGLEEDGTWSDLLYSIVLPLIIFWAPALVSALSTYFRGGLIVSITIGVTPTLTLLLIYGILVGIGTVTRIPELVPMGDAPLWALLGITALIGVLSAFVGFLFGYAGKWTVDTTFQP